MSPIVSALSGLKLDYWKTKINLFTNAVLSSFNRVFCCPSGDGIFPCVLLAIKDQFLHYGSGSQKQLDIRNALPSMSSVKTQNIVSVTTQHQC